jgi:hypothetical protein
MLLKQDKVAVLESRLESIDYNERRALFLQSSRDDKNTERATVLNDLDRALADYGKVHDPYGAITSNTKTKMALFSATVKCLDSKQPRLGMYKACGIG